MTITSATTVQGRTTRLSAVTVRHKGDIAWVESDTPPANATSTAMRAALLDAVPQAQNARCAVFMGAGQTFCADDDMLAINARTRFALPKVIPGAGGTRCAPRRIRLAASMDIACSDKVLDARAIKNHGLPNQVVNCALKTAARRIVANLPTRPGLVNRQECAPMDQAKSATNPLSLDANAYGCAGKTRSPDEICGLDVAVSAKERARLVEDGMAKDDAAVNVGQMQGQAFPCWRGDPMPMVTQPG